MIKSVLYTFRRLVFAWAVMFLAFSPDTTAIGQSMHHSETVEPSRKPLMNSSRLQSFENGPVLGVNMTAPTPFAKPSAPVPGQKKKLSLN